MNILGLSVQDRRVVGVLYNASKLILRRSLLESVDVQLVGACDTVGRVEPLFPILVGDLKCIELIRVGLLV